MIPDAEQKLVFPAHRAPFRESSGKQCCRILFLSGASAFQILLAALLAIGVSTATQIDASAERPGTVELTPASYDWTQH